ncbi:MAG: prenyltransferase/squalene oxidase repeat-containing protein [Myxococcota bacterium]
MKPKLYSEPQPSTPTFDHSAAVAAPPEHVESVTPSWQPLATTYLDERTRSWLDDPPKVRNHFPCAMSCHTTHPYMFVRPGLGDHELLAEARRRLVERVEQEGPWSAQVGFYGREGGRTWTRSLATEAVLNASALALSDRAMGREPTAQTLAALDRMWEVQRGDGAWDWLDFSFQPWEAGNDDWGAVLGALAVGAAGQQYGARHAAPIDGLRGYLQGRIADERDPMSLHDAAGALWAGRHLDDWVPEAARGRIVGQLIDAQRDDGGWALRDLVEPGRMARRVRKPDGYATGLATFVLCSQPDGARAAARGLRWLREHQNEDGSWPAWSLNRDRKRSHLHMRDAAAAYAVLALTSCEG